jgi:hypothetical protein
MNHNKKWFTTATNTTTSTTLETSLQQMEMEALFRKKMWNHIVLGVSFWSFDKETFNF